MRFLILFIMVVSAFSYELAVLNKKESEKLGSVGFSCEKRENMYVCFSSDDMKELKRVKDFLKVKFNINARILNKKTTVSKSVKVPQKRELPKSVTGNYCIQILSFKNLETGKKRFEFYKKFPFARVEKIGGFYVLRIGEGNYRNIERLKKRVDGMVRKCDLKPERIILSNFDVKKAENRKSNIDKNLIGLFVKPVSSGNSSLKKMYHYLNIGELIEAKKLALKLKKRYPDDTNLVLGIVAMKKNNFKKACSVFSSLHTAKGQRLKKDACYTYYVKKGFRFVDISPKQALFFFNKALQYKPDDKNALLGKGYSYTNLKKYKKAYRIFKNLHKRYPKDTKILQGYLNILYLSEKFDELERVKSSLPDNLKNELVSVEFYMQLKKAQKLMKEKKYERAEEILTTLYTKKPDDINVLLTLGNLYFQTERFDRALSFYKNVLIISSDNIYALKGAEAIYMKKGDYEKALKYSDEIVALDFKDKNREKIKKFYYIENAEKELKKNNILKAKEFAKKAYSINNKDALVLALLGDIAFKENKNDLAYLYYAKSYRNGADNFGVRLKFLYALLKLNLFDQIKIILSKTDISSLSDKNETLLRKFYVDLYVKYANYLLANKEYKDALAVVNNGLLMEADNYNLLSEKGWICLKLKKYKCAKKYFQLALEQKDDGMLKYGMALVSLNQGDKKEAEKILDSIYTDDNKLKVKIADAYVRIGEIEKAKRVLNGVDERTPSNLKKTPVNSYKKEEKFEEKRFFPNPFLERGGFQKNDDFLTESEIKTYPVKKKIVLKDSAVDEYISVQNKIAEIEQNYLSNLKLGFKFRNKSGEKGTSRLTRISFPYLEGEYFINHNKKLTFTIDGESLKSGKSADINNSLKNNVTGVGLKIGFETDTFKIHLGVTPLDTGVVSSALTGDVSGKIKKNQNSFYLKIYRDSLTDTLTSYVGNEINGTEFSRVLKNGIKLGYKKDLDRNGSFFYTDISFNYLNGKNIDNNNNIEGECLYLNYVGDSFLDKNFLGFYINLGHYDNNQAFFTPPYGGYFSPNFFLLAMPRYEGYLYSDDRKFISKLTLMAGGSYIDNWNHSSSNFAYDAGYSLKYLFMKQGAVESGVDFRNSKDYNDIFFTLAFRYYFGKKLFFNNKDIDKFSERIVNW